jgi:hypothetical protein
MFMQFLTTHSVLHYLLYSVLSVCLSCAGFDLCDIEDLCRVGAAVASAKCAIHVGGLQHLSDCMAQSSGVSKGHTRRLGQLLPPYLLALLKWSESESENDGEVEGSVGQREQSSSSRRYQGRGQCKDDPYKAFIRTKLDRVSQIFQSSKYLADTAPIGSVNTEKAGAAEAGVGEREIVGETSGQLISSTAPTANLPSSKVLRTSLVRQMESLTDNLRLLAGPLGGKEEMEDTSIAAGGDSLSRLRTKLRSDPGFVGHVPLDQFNPDEFEKEEKTNFVVTDYIDENTATEKADVKTEKRQRARRDLPVIRLTESEGYRLKRELRESCGPESPISRLSVRALMDLLSYPDTDGTSTGVDADTGMDKGEKVVAVPMKKVGGIETALRSDGSDLTSGGFNTATQKGGQNSQSSSTSSDDRGSDSVDSNSNSRNGTREDEGVNLSAVGITAEQYPISVPVLVPDPPSQFLSEFLAVQSALRSPGSGSCAQVLSTEDSTDPAVESRTSSTGSTSARKAEMEADVVAKRGDGFRIKGEKVLVSRATPQSPATNVKEDPAAVHRRKVKQRLAALSSSAVNSVSEGENPGERRKEGMPDSSAISDRSLLEEQTDILARLVEQRIHDRWIQAAKPPTPPHPFR